MLNLIQTNESFLNQYDLPITLNPIIENIIKELDNKLLVNPNIFVFGKKCIQHRAIGFFSNESVSYKYSGQIAKAQKLTNDLELLLEYINNNFKADYNGILVNKYYDGNDYIGKHSDDESNLSNIGVMAISYGTVRKFRIRDKQTNKIVKDIPTISNKIIHMGGNFQSEFTHEIPVEEKVKGTRFSLTFRKHIE